MNLVLFESNEMGNDGTVRLQDRRSEHIIKILGCKPGDTIRAGVVNGPMGRGEIVSIGGSGRKAEVVVHFVAENIWQAPPAVDIILGMVRPIMLKRLLAQVTSLGIGRIFLIKSNRAEKSFFNTSLLKDENYRPFLLQGLEQAKDTWVPHVSVHARFRPFIEDFIPSIAKDYARMLVAHPEDGLNLRQAIGSKTNGRILLAVGPEGGWVDFEIAKFKEHFFIPVSLGNRILRTDTAVVALLAQLLLLRRD